MDWILFLQIVILMILTTICVTTTINSINEKRHLLTSKLFSGEIK